MHSLYQIAVVLVPLLALETREKGADAVSVGNDPPGDNPRLISAPGWTVSG